MVNSKEEIAICQPDPQVGLTAAQAQERLDGGWGNAVTAKGTRSEKDIILQKRPADAGDKRILLYLTERGEALNRAHLTYDEAHAGETMNLVRSRHTDEEIDTAFEVIKTWLDCRRYIHEQRRIKKESKSEED